MGHLCGNSSTRYSRMSGFECILSSRKNSRWKHLVGKKELKYNIIYLPVGATLLLRFQDGPRVPVRINKNCVRDATFNVKWKVSSPGRVF